MGGGLKNFNKTLLLPSSVSYKVISRGWMDLCNPGAGYDSASAGTKVALKVGENHDYTIYLQPNLYTVKEGHKLALVIYTYEPGKANYSQDYQITLENASVSAEIPVDEIPAVPALPFTDVPADTELYAAVEWAYFSDPQITAGVTETTFAPANTCTRAEIVTFLYRLAGEPDVSGTALPFTDVAEDAYYADAVKWAAETGLIGYTTVEQKYVSRFNLRMLLPRGSRADMYIQYDSDGVWHHCGHMEGVGTKSFLLPVRPRRCDHFRLRIEGEGEVRVYSFAKILETGSDA